MHVQLLVSEWCPSCHRAEAVWREVAEQRDIRFEVVDMGQPEGRELVSRLRLKTVPALVIDGELRAIGVQSREEARALVADAPQKAGGGARHVGLGMAASTRFAVLSALAWLVVAGALLTLHAGLFAAGAARPAPVHVFALGFVSFLIFGLAEHMLPRFTGNPVRFGVLVWGQLALAHAGVVLMTGGFYAAAPAFTAVGGGLFWLAYLLLAVRLVPVLWPRRSRD